MNVQIVYFSKTGNTAKLAHTLADTLPVKCRLVNVSKEQPTLDADVYLIGFPVQRGACPLVLLDWLEELEEKQILLFATGGLASFEEYHRRLNSLIIPFLPDTCCYHGLFLCQGSLSEEGYAYLKSNLSAPQDERSVQNLEKLYRYSQNHPDEHDIEAACQFVRQKLSL